MINTIHICNHIDKIRKLLNDLEELPDVYHLEIADGIIGTANDMKEKIIEAEKEELL